MHFEASVLAFWSPPWCFFGFFYCVFVRTNCMIYGGGFLFVCFTQFAFAVISILNSVFKIKKPLLFILMQKLKCLTCSKMFKVALLTFLVVIIFSSN